ncbi:MarR family winged helix-turn-helix transcriptional regulator [Streptomyces bikiniensis]|uniref:MarR family winged helix-turn-helix transcriptional regulator n=1 Tax=Streptomyces bikiniensis TaxID=1896 RepID=UPI00068ECDE6|nr:MarR family winged helix-turn-helix transcriptional regulator [Streptomyces bikiniensis]
MPLSLQLAGIGRIVREEVEGRLKEVGLSVRLLGVMGHLSASPGLSISELARRARISAPSMLSVVRRLEAEGLVERVSPTGRGNTAQLNLTDAGRQARARADETLSDLDGVLFGSLPPEQREALAGAFQRVGSTLLDPAARSAR